MQKYVVIKAYRIFVLACLFGLLAGFASGATLHLNDNSTVNGEVVNGDNSGIILKLPDGSYSDRIPWNKLSQADLKDLDQNPKLSQFVEPYIDPGQEERPSRKTDIEVKSFHQLPRPAGHSFIAALFTTPMGIFIVLLMYTANLYAAYEVSLFRGHSVGLACGVSAAVPFIGPIIFLSMKPQVKHKTADWQIAEQQMDASIAAVAAADHAAPAEIAAAEVAAEASAGHAAQAVPAQPAAPAHPPAKIFPRGQYTFNRRFFETQMPAFFAMSRPESEKDKVLQVKSARGMHIAQRICRISQTELCLQVEKGAASEEVVVPFVEIQEVQIKHKDA